MLVMFGILLGFSAGVFAQQHEIKRTEGKNQLIKEFFADKIEEDGYLYSFPENKAEVFVNPKNEAELMMIFSPHTYSGCAVGHYPTTDLTDVRYSGYLEFKIKGKDGNEPLMIYLVDSEEKDGMKAETPLTHKEFVVKRQWQTVSVPLSLFSADGAFWRNGRMNTTPFDWSDVLEVMFKTPPAKDGGKTVDGDYRITVKDIRIVSVPRRQIAAIEQLKYDEKDVIKTDTKTEGTLGCYTGAFRQDLPPKMARYEDYNRLAGKQGAQVMWYRDWSDIFPVAECEAVWKAGALPHITWEPWMWDKSSEIFLQDILSGDFDQYITDWATDAKKYGKPVLVRFAHEFNGNWYPWSTAHNDKNADLYIQTYRYIVDMFRKVGADNVKWVWSPNFESVPNKPWNEALRAYPGDEYVDWIGMSLYNFGSNKYGSKWQSFNQLVSPLYFEFVKNIPSKPIMITEIACAEQGGDKAAWIRLMNTHLQTKFTEIRAICWFDMLKEADWRIDSSLKSLDAYQKVVHEPYYKVDRDTLWKIPELVVKEKQAA